MPNLISPFDQVLGRLQSGNKGDPIAYACDKPGTKWADKQIRATLMKYTRLILLPEEITANDISANALNTTLALANNMLTQMLLAPAVLPGSLSQLPTQLAIAARHSKH